MKKIFFSIGVIVCVIILSLHVSFSTKGNKQLVQFENIEALSQSEGGGGISYCIGNGSVDCPFYNIKVKVSIH